MKLELKFINTVQSDGAINKNTFGGLLMVTVVERNAVTLIGQY